MASTARRLEAGVAVILTIAAVWLHWLAAVSAGALWRDEANTVGLATLPRVADVWNNLQYDSFPVVWLAVIRAFAGMFGPMNDSAFRALGFFIGLSLVAALWLNARVFGHRFPVIALALIGLSPSVIRWGDSMRAYGLGMVLILVTAALIWRFLDKPSPARFLAATILAVLSVHTLYYDSVLLLALCAGAVAVSAYRRKPTVAAQIVGMGVMAAFSLIPYSAVIHRATAWNALVRIQDYTLAWFWTKLFEALMPAGSWAFVAWLVFFVLALAAGIVAVFAPRVIAISNGRRELALFTLVVLLVGSVGSFVFLQALAYYTQPWYYLTLVLITGLAIDVLLAAALTDERLRIATCLAALAIATGTMLRAPAAVSIRMTNVDIVALRLNALTAPRDLIIVNPWYDGVSFNRYYRGRASWMTSPPVPFHRFHRYDLVMGLTQSGDDSDALQPVLASVKATMSAGGTVYVVGSFPPPHAVELPSLIPAAADQHYLSRWASELGDFLRSHATSIDVVAIPSDRRVNRYENMTITAVRGWRQSPESRGVLETSRATTDSALRSDAAISRASPAGTM